MVRCDDCGASYDPDNESQPFCPGCGIEDYDDEFEQRNLRKHVARWPFQAKKSAPAVQPNTFASDLQWSVWIGEKAKSGASCQSIIHEYYQKQALSLSVVFDVVGPVQSRFGCCLTLPCGVFRVEPLHTSKQAAKEQAASLAWNYIRSLHSSHSDSESKTPSTTANNFKHTNAATTTAATIHTAAIATSIPSTASCRNTSVGNGGSSSSSVESRSSGGVGTAGMPPAIAKSITFTSFTTPVTSTMPSALGTTMTATTPTPSRSSGVLPATISTTTATNPLYTTTFPPIIATTKSSCLDPNVKEFNQAANNTQSNSGQFETKHALFPALSCAHCRVALAYKGGWGVVAHRDGKEHVYIDSTIPGRNLRLFPNVLVEMKPAEGGTKIVYGHKTYKDRACLLLCPNCRKKVGSEIAPRKSKDEKKTAIKPGRFARLMDQTDTCVTIVAKGTIENIPTELFLISPLKSEMFVVNRSVSGQQPRVPDPQPARTPARIASPTVEAAASPDSDSDEPVGPV